MLEKISKSKKWTAGITAVLCVFLGSVKVAAHEAKDFDDSILYKIDFEMPDFEKHPALRNNLRTFYTHEHEKYDCVIPVMEDVKEELEPNENAFPPYVLLQPLQNPHSCSYRIEAYWSYEICHGQHVRQYHEEREGKNVKFQEYYLGLWSDERFKNMKKTWEENYKSGIKYKTLKIDNTNYPYFEMEMGEGTMCNIINAPRTTTIRYVCYPQGKNEIYSFKETSSCNYEAVILNSMLCIEPAFRPEESKEVSIMCYNSPQEPHKPLSMLRQELSDMQMSEDDFPVSKEANAAAVATLARTVAGSERSMILNKLGNNVEELILEIMAGTKVNADTELAAQQSATGEAVGKTSSTSKIDMSAVLEFISGRSCLIGGTGWWKYEFCYGRHVRQFHKDKKSETELFLGYFNLNAHQQWISKNPDRVNKRNGPPPNLWHHYEKGTRCDRTGQPREVDVKLTCTPITNSATAVSMYLLEPKTCQYILVVESPLVCDMMTFADEYNLVYKETIQKITHEGTSAATAETTNKPLSTEKEVLTDENKKDAETPPEDVRA